MGMFQEFKEFIGRGNVVDLAVGVIMGAAFGKIVNSVVNDVIMPPIGYIIGGIDFKDLAFELPKKTIQIPDVADPTKMVDKVLGPVSIKYGNLIQMTFEFLIVAFAVFLLVKAVNTVMKKKAAEPAPPPAQEVLLTEIRDLLKIDKLAWHWRNLWAGEKSHRPVLRRGEQLRPVSQKRDEVGELVGGDGLLEAFGHQ